MFQRRLHRHVLSCASLLTLVASLHAADIHVPGDAPTIQDAVARAQDGDVILVGPGVWAGPVLVAGKAVRLVAVQGPMVTTIDGGSSPSAVVLSGTAGAATLEGFAVTGGTACRIALPAGKATVSRCRVARGAGRGIEVTGPGTTLIEDCLVRDNAGGGVLASGPLIPGSVLVSRCDIERNGSAAVAQGGGLRGDTIRAVDSLLAGNVARRGGGAAFVGAIEGCTFRGNEATVEGGAYYAIQFDEFSGAYLVKDTAFLGNTAPRAGGVLYPDPGFTLSPSHLFVGCTFAGNQDDGGGIGLEAHITAVAAGSALSIDHCTFVDDALTASDKVFVTNSILRGAGTPFVDCKGLTVSFSDVQGGWPGTGNIDADPLFVDAAHQVFALLPGSPC
ncbi:MAG TPA: right-handed parallel beta-helix repeat-containing protein, partial [Planctomycetota bacterium]|nr:right-handed parallel beta-helix repeat-containing protein [Planctomycetota bacterium]